MTLRANVQLRAPPRALRTVRVLGQNINPAVHCRIQHKLFGRSRKNWRVLVIDLPKAAADRTTTQGTVKQSRRVTDVMVVYSYAFTMRKFASTSACREIRPAQLMFLLENSMDSAENSLSKTSFHTNANRSILASSICLDVPLS